MAQPNPTIWSVGHSTRSLEEFIGLLIAHGIQAIADVRRFPGSRRLPHFAKDSLSQTLTAKGISYHWLPELGGRRRALAHSPNTVWRNASFRGYADYLGTPEFAEGLEELLALAADHSTAMMCAEALWWRCHRSLIADVLRLRGIDVIHIGDATHATLHPYTSAARIVDGKLSYEAPPDLL
jgi:uncharacterized protein (DUF488 family)